MPNVVIVGGGGHGVAVFDVLINHPDFSVLGYMDQHKTKAMSNLPINYLGTDDNLPNLIKKPSLAVIGIGQIKSSEQRITVTKKFINANILFATVVSPNALVSTYSGIQNGTVILHHAFVNAGCQIGEFNIINSATVIEHGVITGNFVHIAPRAVILGDVQIGHGSFIGAGAIIREGVTVGKNCIVGAGVTVKYNVEDGRVVSL